MKLSQLMFNALGIAVLSSSAFAGAHTWKVNEIFSNASGTIQFIELRCPTGSENFTSGLKVTSDSTGMQATLPGTSGSTLNKSLLLATAAFAALPGAPTPNVIIPANFFNRNGDTVRYHVYDSMTFAAGGLPSDCVHSLSVGGVVTVNSPTNFLGSTAQINCSTPCTADVAPAGGNGTVNVDDLLAVINSWGRCPVPPTTCPTDIAPAGGNGSVNVDDLLAVINAWGQCPP